MKNTISAASVFLLATGGVSHALSVSGVSNANGTDLIAELLGPSSGVTVTGGQNYVGADNQGGTYSGFGTVGVGAHDDGIVLSSGYADQVPETNTNTSWDHGNLGLGAPQGQPGGSTSDAELTQILNDAGQPNSNVNDVNYLEFEFTLDDPTQTAIEAEFVFGTDEFPDQGVTDIFAFIVDGVNYAEFPDGSLINFQDGANEAAYNDNTGGAFNIEWDGITDVLKVVGLLDPTVMIHTLKIAIADTSDTVFDSAVYIASLSGSNDDGGGIKPIPPTAVVPLPAGFPMLLAALGGLALTRRKFRG